MTLFYFYAYFCKESCNDAWLFLYCEWNERIKMIEIKLYDDKKIDTSSDEIREKVSKSVAEYIKDNWDIVVKTKNILFDGKYEVSFRIEL